MPCIRRHRPARRRSSVRNSHPFPAHPVILLPLASLSCLSWRRNGRGDRGENHKARRRKTCNPCARKRQVSLSSSPDGKGRPGPCHVRGDEEDRYERGFMQVTD